MGQTREESELFIVEGDSAGGSAKQARDKNFQAIMPIRGKILNTWEVSSDEVLASQEVHDIAIAIGVDPVVMIYLNYVTAKSVFWPMPTRMVYTLRLCFALYSLNIFQHWLKKGICM